jgi:phage baseplate assembly protein W
MATTPISASLWPIGLVVPIVSGPSGYFQQSFDTNTQVKTNLLNFLNTKRGERRMMPEFGTQLYELLFEQYTDGLEEILKNTLTNEIQFWIPEITILKLDIINTENPIGDDNYKLRLIIQFKVNQTNSVDTVEILLENTKI